MCRRYRQMYCSWREISSWKTNSLYVQKKKKVPYIKILEASVLSHSPSNAHTHTHTHTHTHAHTHTAFLVTLLNSSGFPWPPYWPCVLSGSRAPARHGASRPAEWGRKTSPETWSRRKAGERGKEERKSVQLSPLQQWFVSHDYATVRKSGKRSLS